VPDGAESGSRRGDDPSQRLRPREFDPTRLITIVSGLPRSGTSMMMQMLGAAGLDLATDGVRVADASNPRGYFELEAVKRIHEDDSFLKDCVGRVVKIVAPLLPLLPDEYDYQIILMERDLDQVLASQGRMLARLGGGDRSSKNADGAVAVTRDEALRSAFRGQLEKVRGWLESSERVESLLVPHASVIEAPVDAAIKVAEFIAATGFRQDVEDGSDGALSWKIEAMAGVVDPSLHRA
jgi:hypothetical protein